MAARRASALSKPGPRKVSNSPSIESQQHATRRNRGIARGRTPEVGLDDAYSTADAEEAVLKQAQLASELEAIRSRVAAADQIVAEAPTVDFGHLRSQFSAVRDEVESIDKVERDSLRASIGTWFTSKVSAVVEDDLLSDEEEDQADAIQHSSDTLAQLSKSSAPASVQRFKMALEKLKRVKCVRLRFPTSSHSLTARVCAGLAGSTVLLASHSQRLQRRTSCRSPPARAAGTVVRRGRRGRTTTTSCPQSRPRCDRKSSSFGNSCRIRKSRPRPRM